MNRPESDRAWLEQVLRRDLQRVSAPDDLWKRVRFGKRERRNRTGTGPVWLGAGALALAASLLAVTWGHHTRPASREPAIQSDNAGEIRAWVRERTGLEIPFAAVAPASIRMVGARIVEPAVPAVEVRFRAGGHDAVLLVVRSASTSFQSRAHGMHSGSASTVSWTTAGQSYTLTAPDADALHAACSACHAQWTL
jgi:hypothetical protein